MPFILPMLAAVIEGEQRRLSYPRIGDAVLHFYHERFFSIDTG
jgi:hypothetical protein